MSQSWTPNRRDFVNYALGAAAAFIPSAKLSHEGEIVDRLPPSPKEKPLVFRPIADAFDAFIIDPANKILISRPDKTLCFASATGSESDGGLTTLGPILLGKILRGQNVDTLSPGLAAYFHQSAGIFLDGSQTDSVEYWYLMNVNALAFAITRCKLAQDQAAIERTRRSADRLIALAHQIKYNFNDQGYDFAKNKPWTKKDIYRQPDTVGGYAYLMLFAFEMFGDDKYRQESLTALHLYQSFPKNPWYEIPSGAMACLASARLGQHYHLDDVSFAKALGWALDPDSGCLQTGEWGGREVNGLMGGWGNEPAGQAYSMESMVPLPYLLPCVRYYPQFAAAIGRYVLDAAANLRWFYPNYLPDELQSAPGFAPAVPYERLSKRLNGHSPYAAGDYAGHRSVYGGAYALWLAELILPTADELILQLDLTKTDFLAKADESAFLFYNPNQQEREIAMPLPAGNFDIHDITDRHDLQRSATGTASITIPARGARVVAVRAVKAPVSAG